MKSVYKYPLNMNNRQLLELPWSPEVPPEIVQVADQFGVPTVWAVVDPNATLTVKYALRIFGTGHEVDESVDLKYLGCSFSGPFVWHVFQEVE